MKQAADALNNQIVNNLGVSSTKTDKNGNRICQKGEDEAFDNCVVAVQKDEDAQDDDDIKTANQQMASREYRDANLDLLARTAPTELQVVHSMDCCGNTHTTINECKCPEPEKPKPAPEKTPVEQAVEVAVKVVEKAQKKEEKILKKVEVAKARQPNGIIDLVSQVLSENAQK